MASSSQSITPDLSTNYIKLDKSYYNSSISILNVMFPKPTLKVKTFNLPLEVNISVEKNLIQDINDMRNKREEEKLLIENRINTFEEEKIEAAFALRRQQEEKIRLEREERERQELIAKKLQEDRELEMAMQIVRAKRDAEEKERQKDSNVRHLFGEFSSITGCNDTSIMSAFLNAYELNMERAVSSFFEYEGNPSRIVVPAKKPEQNNFNSHSSQPVSNHNNQNMGYNSQPSYYAGSQNVPQSTQSQGNMNTYPGNYNATSSVLANNIQSASMPTFNSNSNNNYQNQNSFQNQNTFQNQNNFQSQNNFQNQNYQNQVYSSNASTSNFNNPNSYNQTQQYSSPVPNQNLNQTASPTPMANPQSNWGGNNYSVNTFGGSNSVQSTANLVNFNQNPQTNYNPSANQYQGNNLQTMNPQPQSPSYQPGQIIKLNITLPSDSTILLELPGTDTLFQVRQHVQKLGRAWSYSPFTLVRQNPRIVYNEQHMSMTLYDLGLSPECYIKCTLGVFHS